MMIPPAVLSVGVDARNYDAVVKRPKLHINLPKSLLVFGFRTKKRSTAGRKTNAVPISL